MVKISLKKNSKSTNKLKSNKIKIKKVTKNKSDKSDNLDKNNSINDKEKYIYYPEFSDPDFYKKIYYKKEFYKNRIKPQNKTLNELCNPKTSTLMPQQEFLKNYISINTPYNGILMFHGTGVGKTCAAISIAEGFKEALKKNGRKVLVLLSGNIVGNFKKEIFSINKNERKKRKDSIVQCTGRAYSLDIDDKLLTKDKKEKEISQKINNNYTFRGYQKFTNEVMAYASWDGKTKSITPTIQKAISRKYSNTVIIVDEVHNIKAETQQTKIVPPVFEAVIKYSKNIRLVLMSATPMYNKSNEIIYLLNLLLLNDKRKPINESDVFEQDGSLKPGGEDIIRNASKGYVSYLRGEKPPKFPYRIYPTESSIPIIKYDILGQELDENQRLKLIKVINTPMSDFQYKYYNVELNKDLTRSKSGAQYLKHKDEMYLKNEILEDGVLDEEISDSLGQLSRATLASNIIYPSSNGDGVCGGNGIEKNETGRGAIIETVRTDQKNKKKYITYKYQKHAIFNYGGKNEKPFLDEDHLEKYSNKFFTALQFIKKSSGIVYVYSTWISGGVLPFALMLEQNGYKRYTVEGEKQLLDYSPNKVGGGGRREYICYKCGNNTKHPFHKPDNPEYHKWAPAQYMILTGNKDLTKLDPELTPPIVNNPKNIYGKDIKVIIGTVVTGEGVDFKRIRQVHLLEPWFNISRLEQTIGRAIRNCSHEDLETSQQNVEIFQYASGSPISSNKKLLLTESIDLRIYRLAEAKDRKIKYIERILKEAAVDCALNREGNIFTSSNIVNVINSRGQQISIKEGDEPNSRLCEYNKECNYKCDWMPPTGSIKVNTDTYHMQFAASDIELTKQHIKTLYKYNYAYDLETIIKYVISNIPDIEYIYIYKALDDFISSKSEIIYDRFDREGYLIFKGKYYIYQPTELNDKKLPIYYRETPLKYKRSDIKINENIYKKVTDQDNKLNITKDVPVGLIIKYIFDNIEQLFNELHEFSTINSINTDMCLFTTISMVLDRLSHDNMIIVLKTILSNNYTKDISLEFNKATKRYANIINNIIEYYEKNIIRMHRDINYDKTKLSNDNIKNLKIVGFRVGNNYYCINDNSWNKCSKDMINKILLNDTLKKTTNFNIKKVYGDITGLLSRNDKGEVVFKILDHTLEKGAITAHLKKSKRTEITGRVCKTYKLTHLHEIILKLNLKIVSNKNKIPNVCNEIEYILRVKQSLDKNGITWFMNEL